MKHRRVLNHSNVRHILPIGAITGVAAALTIAAAPPASAERVRVPRAPANLQVPQGNRPFLEGHAIGTQSYICLPSGSAFAWTFFAPQATLFNDDRRQIITHFLSPNPFEGDTPRATWQHAQDSSTVWGLAIETSSDPKFVRNGAIPWLLLQVVGGQDGPRRADKLTATTFIQRLNTIGGTAPPSGCAAATDVGKKALVPYQADYFFYRYPHGDPDDDY
jgi:hypothetical protein